MTVISPVKRRGFPFSVPRNVPIWDGETIYLVDADSPSGAGYFIPSASDTHPIAVCGDGSLYPWKIGNTIHDAAKFFYRAKAFQIAFSFGSSESFPDPSSETVFTYRNNLERDLVVPNNLTTYGDSLIGAPIASQWTLVRGEDGYFYADATIDFASWYTFTTVTTGREFDPGSGTWSYTSHILAPTGDHIIFRNWRGVDLPMALYYDPPADPPFTPPHPLAGDPILTVANWWTYGGKYDSGGAWLG